LVSQQLRSPSSARVSQGRITLFIVIGVWELSWNGRRFAVHAYFNLLNVVWGEASFSGNRRSGVNARGWGQLQKARR